MVLDRHARRIVAWISSLKNTSFGNIVAILIQYLKKVVGWIAPQPQKSEDGRDQWPSRAAFLLAAMGGCAGQGNLLRYPSVVYSNYGLQWFIPYLLAVFLVAIPALILEISIGQAYRGGTVIAFNNINKRLKGVGLGPVIVSFVVVQIEDFYMGDVVANVDPIAGNLTANNDAVENYTQYPGVALIGETVGWSAFLWFLIWISIFRGVGLTGRVVYWTMGLPIVTTIIIVARSCSLENAREGVRLLWATWRSDQLASGTVWQTAVGQVFFSTGIGFGYFTSYASYNSKHSNAVMDAVLICGSNVLFENFAAFAVFGVVGYLRRWPQDGERLGAFVVGFLTLPEAVLHMPGANWWAVLLFFTLVVLGFSSAFVMLDAVATLVVDAGVKLSRPVIVTGLTIISFLMCLPYCTEFGFYLLDGIDRWTNNVALIFVVWSELVSSTTAYRWHDVVSQTGLPAFVVYNVGYLGGQIVGVTVAHSVSSPTIGAGAGFGTYILCTAASVLVATTPSIKPVHVWGRASILSRFWYLALYSGNQLRRDLNGVIGGNGNWNIPSFWPILLRYVSAPVLAIVFSFAYPEFYSLRYDPMMIAGFTLAHIGLLTILLAVVLPRYYAVLIPSHRRAEGTEVTVANQTLHQGISTGPGAVELESGIPEPIAAKRRSKKVNTNNTTTFPKF
ncbi:Sodium:neurotransmitter symporter [Penicillium argentinense]|uniref:Sodium:neurotransmitter symporter n=1 Tax=Penicillium argentinense TaxID=1131581 RepID=A0A9W9F7D0_9EURO|nr:Sodium:neurotransmitter symporter [Penicillium argentinense]KAJ5094955.1 Sodium:neurotransmitter symporter [Penicillium argentinense]